MFLLNLKKSQIGRIQNDQSWLNDVYKSEKFDIGVEYNALLAVPEVCDKKSVFLFCFKKHFKIMKETSDSASLYHFAGPHKPHQCPPDPSREVARACELWRYYRFKLFNEILSK